MLISVQYVDVHEGDFKKVHVLRTWMPLFMCHGVSASLEGEDSGFKCALLLRFSPAYAGEGLCGSAASRPLLELSTGLTFAANLNLSGLTHVKGAGHPDTMNRQVCLSGQCMHHAELL